MKISRLLSHLIQEHEKNVHGHIKFNNGNGSPLAPYKINSTYLAKVQSF